MKMEKYELLQEDTKKIGDRTLYRIRALVAIGMSVSVGDLGGYVESEKCLDHSGDAWVYGDAHVYGDARVSGNAWVSGDARVYGNAWVSGDARVYGDDAIVWFSNVGSENGTLTVCAAKGALFVSRGCFSGTDSEFMEAVEKRHGLQSKIGREYSLLMDVARSRIEVIKDED